MQKKIKRHMLFILTVFLLELVGIILIVFFSKLYPEFKYNYDIVVIFSCVIIVFDIFYFFSVLSRISNSRKKNDITAVEIIGEGVEEIYNFGQIGVIIVDDENNVIWANDWFEDIQTKIIDQNIYTWKKELIALQDKKTKTVNVDINNRVYEVKYLKEANLFIFKDVTDFEALLNFQKDHAPVVGILSIDNYQEVASLIDESKSTELFANISKIIFDYFKKFGIFIKKIRSDGYSFVTTKVQYEKMLEDKFPLLDEIRELSKGEDFELTLSMGIALGHDDYLKLNDLAAAALDVCLSRGGDQVVISPFGEKLIFIGGKTEAKTKRSKVKVKVLSKSLYTLASDADRVYVMGHKDMDLDALGAALGIFEFVQQVGKKVHLVYDEKIVEYKTRKAFKQMYSRDEIKDMIISPKVALEEMTTQTLLILVDVHKPSLALSKRLTDRCNKVAIIDHHRRGEEFVEMPVFVYIEPAASSASELIAEMIKYNDKRLVLSERAASIMLSGILLDTNYYRNKTGERTYDASLILKEFGANNLLADSFLKEEFEEHALKIKIMATAITPHFGVIVCRSDNEDVIDRSMLAIVAQDTLQIKGVNACFVVGRTDSKSCNISARSDGTINVQYLMEKMGGGGHFASAAVQLDNKNVDETIDYLKETLNLYLSEARAEKK